MRIMILALCTFGVSAQMSLLNKIDPHSMLPGKQFGNQYGSNEPIDDDVRFINYYATKIQTILTMLVTPILIPISTSSVRKIGLSVDSSVNDKIVIYGQD